MNETLKEAKRLYDEGFAIHWLHPKSKRPIESGWGSGPRATWEHLKQTYKEGNNVGVRLGSASQIAGKYLTVVDVDVKSKEERHRTEAVTTAKNLVGGVACPTVSSGRGNGSRHLYVLTDVPFKTFNPAQSKEIVKVHYPSKKASKKEIEQLADWEIAAGIRLSHAWEISLYSDGRQVVLPPSIHPDTGNPYKWVKPFAEGDIIPTVEFEIPTEPKDEVKNDKRILSNENNILSMRDGWGDDLSDFEVAVVDLAWLPISEKLREGIINGFGVADRSGFLLPAATGLHSAGLTKNEILTVLTDPTTYLGQCAYEHAGQTKDRYKAAAWVWKYTLKRVMQERSAEFVFQNAPPIEDASARLQGSELEAQTKSVQKEIKWTDYIERTEPKLGHKVKNTVYNIKLILTNVFGKDCVKFNEFANTEELWGKFPWVTRQGKEAYDIDVTMLKDWFVHKWNYEPSEDKLRSVMSIIGFEAKYHPVKTWIEKLPPWDEVSRIDGLLDKYIPCEGNDELRAVIGRRFMVALVKRIYEPGCQADYLLVLEGLQGLHKSSAFRALVGDEWFSDASFNVHDKDAIMVIFSKWLIEFGELSVLDRSTAEATKAFITRRIDRMRAPFDRKARDYPRQCLFAGSTNKDEYLKDDSGNRRYWPFRVLSDCLIEAIRKDREQLFAEAKYYYDINEITYLKEPHLKALMLAQQEAREMHDVLSEQVRNLIMVHERELGIALDDFEIGFFFGPGKLSGIRADSYGTSRVGAVLRKLGYQKYREGGGQRRIIWSRPKQAEHNVHLHAPIPVKKEDPKIRGTHEFSCVTHETDFDEFDFR